MGKVVKWILIIFIGIPLLWAIVRGCSSATENVNNAETDNANVVSGSGDSVSEAVPDLKKNWVYDETKDEMRGDSTYLATNTSTNMVELEFPYSGGTNLNIVLRKDAEHGNDVIFAVNKGQLFCTYNDCYISAKFDDGPVEKFTTAEAEAGSSEVLFLANNQSGFVKKLKSAQSVMIEVQFFNHGKEQFKFDVSDLNWDKF